MKKLIIVFLSLLLSLAMVVPTTATVLADAEKEVKPLPTARAALLIRVPSVAAVGQPVTISVFNRVSHQPVAGAEVYAFKTDRTVSMADKKSYTASAVDYEALFEEEGFFLGETNNEGTIKYKFGDPGRHMLVAFKSKHIPGFSSITITSSNTPGLRIRAPGSAEIGKQVTLTVTETSSHSPVAKAAVYARKLGSSELPKPTVRNVFDGILGALGLLSKARTTDAQIEKAEPSEIADELQNVEEAKRTGYLLGYTDDKGELACTFDDAGYFLLVAVLGEYTPGFARIHITPQSEKALGIRSPDKAEVNKPVPIMVFDRRTNQGVPKAAVYALRLSDIITPVAVPAEKPTTLIITPEPALLDVSVNVETVREKGILLGYTDEKGQVMPVPAFDKAGRYVLAAIMGGYQPALARIAITTGEQKALGIKTPDKAEVGTPVTMTVFERNTSQTVPKAAVYALRIGDNIVPLPAEPTVKRETSVSIAEVENAEVVKSKGHHIGYTDEKGQLVHKFSEGGSYILAAIKDEYLPGFARISIVPAGQRGIGIKVPEKAEAGTSITIVTYDRNTYGPVPKAGVYALRVGDYTAPVPLEPMLKSEAASLAEAEKQAAEVKAKGIFLGYTDENAHLVYRFEKTGHFLLIAVKDGYFPGFGRLTIVPAGIKALMLKVPSEAAIGASVPIYVSERGNGAAVAQAKLFALRLEEVDDVSGSLFKADPAASDTAALEKFSAAVTARGAYIGSTDRNGLLIHTFNALGQYVLVAVKDGYVPDFARIYIKARVVVPQKLDVVPTTPSTSKKD